MILTHSPLAVFSADKVVPFLPLFSANATGKTNPPVRSILDSITVVRTVVFVICFSNALIEDDSIEIGYYHLFVRNLHTFGSLLTKSGNDL